MFLVRKKHRIKKVYLFQKVYLLRGFLKSRVGNDAEHICDLDHPNFKDFHQNRVFIRVHNYI